MLIKEDNLAELSGFILIDKEPNMTSYDVIRELKKIFSPKIKIGHTGTLDPNTTGLLIIALGKATKLIPLLSKNSQKEYQATLKFGLETDTLDITGQIIKEKKYEMPKPEIIEPIFQKFVKKYHQVPPNFSAKKINGKRAYNLAREKKEIDFTKNLKEIEIYENEILDLDYQNNEITFRTLVSKGTYVRSLIRDIAKELNTIATMTQLKRTQSDGFSLENAKKINCIEKTDLISLEKVLLEKYPATFEIEGKLLNLIKNGVQINNPHIIEKFDKIVQNDKLILVDKNTKKLIALYQKKTEKYQKEIMLWSSNEL